MENLYIPETWGWKQELYSAWITVAGAQQNFQSLLPARVTGRERHLYEIVCPDFSGRIPPGIEGVCEVDGQDPTGPRTGIRVSGRFEYEVKGEEDFPVTGDWVLVDPIKDGSRIQTILPRRSSLSRGRAGDRTEEQVLAANIDTLFLVFALDGRRGFLARLLERALVIARNSGASPCVILNKADLADSEYRQRALDEVAFAAPAVPVFALSARTGEGLNELSSILNPGDTIGMIGKSGVGKSALVNALGARRTALRDSGAMGAGVQGVGAQSPGVQSFSDASCQRPLTKEGTVRQGDMRGRHTTTSSHLYRLDSGLLLIDSPGIRELKILGDADDLDDAFPDIAEFAERCRFADCTHSGEPGCAVIEALNSGELDQRRYLAWLDLARERAWFERQTNERARNEDKQKWKRISKLQKELKKSR